MLFNNRMNYMKKIEIKIMLAVLILSVTSLYSLEKATIIYKSGDKLNCMIDNYEIGKYAVVVDDSGNKRIISWDNINEIVFIKDEVPLTAEDESSLPAIETAPVTPPATPPASVPAPVAPASGSMLDQFKNNKTDTTSEEPVNEKEEKFKQEIREENKYQQKPEVDLNKKTGKLSVDYYQTLESDATRRAWIEDGGILKGKGFTANYTFASMEWGDTDFTMNGFGMTYSGTMKWVKPPNYDEGKNIWTAFSLGAMGSFNITFGSMDMDMSYSYWNGYQWVYVSDTMEMNMTMLNYEFSVPLGYTFGLGRYFTQEEWKGLMLGLYWKPNFVMSLGSYEVDGTFYEMDPTSAFNMGGFQWTIDAGSFGALADKLADEAHFSISGFVVPETDETPFMLSVGLGVVWY